METRIRLSTDTNFQNVDDSRSTSIGGRKLSQSLPHHVSNTCYHVLYISEMIQISMEILIFETLKVFAQLSFLIFYFGK